MFLKVIFLSELTTLLEFCRHKKWPLMKFSAEFGWLNLEIPSLKVFE